nr:methyltransferase domain-containing protein [Bacteroidota bacterium]
KHDVTGIDLDIKMLEKANKKKSPALHLTFKHEDGTNIQCNDHVYDAATISFAMHDVPYDIGIKLLQEAKRVISKTGFILIVDYNDLSGFGSRLLYFFASMYESPNYKPFVRRGLASYLLESGFHVESKSTFLGAVQYVTARPV